MIIIVGESGAGKTTLQKELVNIFDTRFTKLVTYTTRPPRDMEQDGVDYHFVTEDEFEELKRNGFFLETATYRGWHYGSPKCDDYSAIAILTPAGLRAAIRAGVPVVSFYLKVDRRSRLIKLLKRGDDIEEAYRRSISDVGQFDGIEGEVDFVIQNEGYQEDIYTLVDIVLKDLAKARYTHNDNN